MDAGYPTADHLVLSQTEYKLNLIGPVPKDTRWQARTGAGFDLARFVIDWPNQQAICPAGKTSVMWSPRCDERGQDIIEVRFAKADCASCPSRPLCTQALRNPRSLKLRQQAQHEALQSARRYQTTPEFKQRYKKRAGVEGTISQATRTFQLRRARYIGLAKTIPSDCPAGANCTTDRYRFGH